MSILLALLFAFGLYYLVARRLTSSGGARPAATLSLTVVKADLITMAQAERIYFAQNGSFASLDQLVSSGGLNKEQQAGREGYTYSVETSAGGFVITARPPANGAGHSPTLTIDQTMEVHSSD